LLIFDKNQDEVKNQCELAEPPSSNLQFHNFSGDIPDQGPPEIEFDLFRIKSYISFNIVYFHPESDRIHVFMGAGRI